jgi:hypothetical protein
MGLLRRPTPGGIVEGGRLGRSHGPSARIRAQSQKTKLRLRCYFHISSSRRPILAFERNQPFMTAVIVQHQASQTAYTAVRLARASSTFGWSGL